MSSIAKIGVFPCGIRKNSFVWINFFREIADTFSIIVEEGAHLVVPVLGVRYPIHVWTE